MQHLYFVTGNQHKVDEAEIILGIPVKVVKQDLFEIQDLDLVKVTTEKVKSAYALVKKPVVVDDVSVEIEAWNKFPGPFIKHLRISGGNQLILKLLKNEKNRNVVIKAAIGFTDGKKLKVFVGEVKGTIAYEERGNNGWGFDPLFIVPSFNKTFGELGEKEKNKISHRRIALDKLKTYLTESGYITS